MNTQELRLYALRRLHELAEAEGYKNYFSLDMIAAEAGVKDRIKVLRLGQDLEADRLIALSAPHDGTSAQIKMLGVRFVEEALSSPRTKEYSARPIEDANLSFESLLHPAIREHAYPQYLDCHLRDAVLNAFIAVFDLIRSRTGLDLDGEALVTQVFSLQRPLLIFSELKTESGRSDQLGFMQILQGVYKGIRNPKSHGLRHDLTEARAAQYLVLASLLARRVEEAKVAET